jgi:hypothetical protein
MWYPRLYNVDVPCWHLASYNLHVRPLRSVSFGPTVADEEHRYLPRFLSWSRNDSWLVAADTARVGADRRSDRTPRGGLTISSDISMDPGRVRTSCSLASIYDGRMIRRRAHVAERDQCLWSCRAQGAYRVQCSVGPLTSQLVVCESHRVPALQVREAGQCNRAARPRGGRQRSRLDHAIRCSVKIRMNRSRLSPVRIPRGAVLDPPLDRTLPTDNCPHCVRLIGQSSVLDQSSDTHRATKCSPRLYLGGKM